MTDDELFEPAASLVLRSSDPRDEMLGDHVRPTPARGRRDQAPHAVALFGLPFDGAVIGRPGARFGPDAIRGELRRLKTEHTRGGPVTWHDYGNARMPRDARRAGEVATRAMLAAAADGGFPVALGGDHSLTYGLVAGIRKLDGPVGVINIDAHLDLRDVREEISSGTPFRRLLDDGLLRANDLVEIGIRDFANSPYYLELAKEHGVTVVKAHEVHDKGIEAIADLAAKKALGPGVKGIYLSLDMDVLDEASAPGVSAPTPGGLDTATLYRLLRAIARRAPLVGMDVMETAPPYDREGMTARAAAYAIMHTVVARNVALWGW